MSDINRKEISEKKETAKLKEVLQSSFGLHSSKTITIQQLINSTVSNLQDNQIGLNKTLSQMNVSTEQYSAVVYDIIKRMV